MEKPFGTDLRERDRAQRPAARDLRRAADLPDRPLPGQGGGAEHPGVPVRQRSVRADLEPQLHRPHPDRHPRDPRSGPARELLRVDRRVQGHGGHPPVPGARVRRDGAADRPGAVRDQRGEEQGLPLAAADQPARRRPRPVRRLPRRAGGRAGLRHRDLHRAAVRASTTGAGPGCRSTCVPASGWPRASGSSRSPSRRRRGACSRPTPGSVARVPTTSPSTWPTSRRCRCPSTASGPGRGCSWRS